MWMIVLRETCSQLLTEELGSRATSFKTHNLNHGFVGISDIQNVHSTSQLMKAFVIGDVSCTSRSIVSSTCAFRLLYSSRDSRPSYVLPSFRLSSSLSILPVNPTVSICLSQFPNLISIFPGRVCQLQLESDVKASSRTTCQLKHMPAVVKQDMKYGGQLMCRQWYHLIASTYLQSALAWLQRHDNFFVLCSGWENHTTLLLFSSKA